MEESVIQLSVVIAAGSAGPSVDAALSAIVDACQGVRHELIVVGDQAPPVHGSPALSGREIRRITRPAGTLTPVLWGAGASVARGRVVAFTTTQMLVATGWGSALHDAVRDDTVGAAGAIGLAPGADGATSALFFVRFSAFLPESVRTVSTTVRDIPGDNAAYLRSAILRHEELLADGFWEVEFHRRFEREGLSLRLLTDAGATMRGPVDFTAATRQRFEHAAEFGASRAARHGESVWRVVLAAPFVPLLLTLRIGRRVLHSSRYRMPFVISLPWLVVLSVAWAAGEAAGALRSGRRAPGVLA